MKDKVLEVLASYGATRFDECGFCTKRGKALKQKVGRVLRLIEEHNVDRVVMYDDKPNNVRTFRSMELRGKKGKAKKVVQLTVFDVGVKAAMPPEEVVARLSKTPPPYRNLRPYNAEGRSDAYTMHIRNTTWLCGRVIPCALHVCRVTCCR